MKKTMVVGRGSEINVGSTVSVVTSAIGNVAVKYNYDNRDFQNLLIFIGEVTHVYDNGKCRVRPYTSD